MGAFLGEVPLFFLGGFSGMYDFGFFEDSDLLVAGRACYLAEADAFES